jgi:hypothetical protein
MGHDPWYVNILGDMVDVLTDSGHHKHHRRRKKKDKQKMLEDDEDWVFFLCLIVFAVIISYLALVALYKLTLEEGSKERGVFDRFLCCWRELYAGKAVCVWNSLCCCCVLCTHSCRAHLCHCLSVYTMRLLWLTTSCFTSFFIDPEFPPDESSLVGEDADEETAKEDNSDIVWVRSMYFNKRNIKNHSLRPSMYDTKMCLFEGRVDARDILCGVSENDWLLSAIATLAEHNGIVDKLFQTAEIDPRGKYSIRLYDPQDEEWKNVVIDDYVPCLIDDSCADGVSRDEEGMPESKFSKPHGKTIWVMLLEKAFAKYCGGYSELASGIPEWALVCMTGGAAWRYSHSDEGTWDRSDLVILESDEDKRACDFKLTSESHDDAGLFDLLRYYHRHGAVLCCSGAKESATMNDVRPGQAFSLLQVRTVRKRWNCAKFFRMIQIRNPWGTGEWTGAWSERSEEWKKYPFVKERLRFQTGDEGTFWMQWEDFCQYWSYISCVDMDHDISTIAPRLHRESEFEGPAVSCTVGWCDYWLMCSGLRHYLWKHDSMADVVDDEHVDTNCGMDASGLYCRICEGSAVHVEDDGEELIHEPEKQRKKDKRKRREESDDPMRASSSGSLLSRGSSLQSMEENGTPVNTTGTPVSTKGGKVSPSGWKSMGNGRFGGA